MRALAVWITLCTAGAPGCAQEPDTAPSSATPADSPATPEPSAARMVAVTFDDLPGIVSGGMPALQAVTDRLLAHIRAAAIPAIGFVNEQMLEVPGQEAQRTALLEQWLDAGLDLGNHTYSHPSFYSTPLAEYQADVLRGERVTRELLAGRGERPRYFRHPFLNTGPDLETKAAFEQFLTEHGYTIAPVTIDNDEWRYAAAYTAATTRGDSALMQRIGVDYLRYMNEVFAFYEELSQDLLGREPAQVLLLHANALNSDWFDELAVMMRDRGYHFVSIERALQDPAYALPDGYVGRTGPSWLQRWALTQGREPGEQPAAPDWITGMN